MTLAKEKRKTKGEKNRRKKDKKEEEQKKEKRLQRCTTRDDSKIFLEKVLQEIVKQ